jgi:hypothetical protein
MAKIHNDVLKISIDPKEILDFVKEIIEDDPHFHMEPLLDIPGRLIELRTAEWNGTKEIVLEFTLHRD